MKNQTRATLADGYLDVEGSSNSIETRINTTSIAWLRWVHLCTNPYTVQLLLYPEQVRFLRQALVKREVELVKNGKLEPEEVTG
jgi:hypothetical protein